MSAEYLELAARIGYRQPLNEVMIAVAYLADVNGRAVFRLSKLAHVSGLSEKTILREFKKASGLFERVEEIPGGTVDPTFYVKLDYEMLESHASMSDAEYTGEVLKYTLMGITEEEELAKAQAQ